MDATHLYDNDFFREKKLKKRSHVQEADIITIKKIDLISLAQRMPFLQDLFQITAI